MLSLLLLGLIVLVLYPEFSHCDEDESDYYLNKLSRLTRLEDPMKTYTLLEEIGSGEFGFAYKAVNQITGGIRCIKKFPLNDDWNIMSSYNEVIITRKLQGHSNIVKYYECFNYDGYIWHVFEFVHGQYMHKYSSSYFTIDQINYTVNQLLSIMKHLSSSRVCHFDISDTNFLFKSDGKLIIIDFGDSYSIHTSDEAKKCTDWENLYYFLKDLFSYQYDYFSEVLRDLDVLASKEKYSHIPKLLTVDSINEALI